MKHFFFTFFFFVTKPCLQNKALNQTIIFVYHYTPRDHPEDTYYTLHAKQDISTQTQQSKQLLNKHNSLNNKPLLQGRAWRTWRCQVCPPPPLILLRPGVCLFSWVPNTTSRLLLAEENQGRGGPRGNKRQAWLERRASCRAQRDAQGGGRWVCACCRGCCCRRGGS